jgi:hypothetical protein
VLGAICCPADIFEPNTGTTGSPSTTWDDYQADADETLTISSTDVDSFRVPVCYGARVTVVARFSHADVDLDLRIRWPRGSIWQQSTSNTDNERIEATVDQLLDGTTLVDRVFVQAYVAEANQCGSYTLDISVDRSGCAF